MKTNYQPYLSQINDPYLNLAIEDWLLRAPQFHDQPILFFYTNTPSVVMGRAQNPWIECDLNLAKELNIDIVRRQSGGGTVYHDLGNVNFSFIVPKAQYDKAAHIQLIMSILRQLGLTVHTDERHNILIMHRDQEYKISGSAFRETKNRCFHHATLLFDANLEQLSPVLNPPDYGIEAKGVKSVRSPVINLAQISQEASIENFLDAAKHHLKEDLTLISKADINGQAMIAEACQLYQTWDWVYGKTLPFIQRRMDNGQLIEIAVKHGIVEHTQQRFIIPS